MGLRLITSPQSTNVVPLRPTRRSTTIVDGQPPVRRHPRNLLIVALLRGEPETGNGDHHPEEV
jgi:hypothetical protein